ncbi:MAG: DUF4405 domain-containing protein [Chlorobiaceae bacterium]|nr:DUF4405 domain-containing protein [Chlorobiaceae bacterium]
MNTILKSFSTPLAIGAFLISAVTGILIFFDIEMGAVEPVHKWLSWLLLGGVSLHIVSNWKPFSGYFSKKPAIGIIGLACVVAIGSLLPMFSEDEEGEGRGAGVAAKALESSSLETVALVLKTTPQALAARLDKSGIVAGSNSSTIQEIAARNGKSGKIVLAAVLGGAEKKNDGDRDGR